VAHQLKRRGIARVHPLEGGLERWMALDFPVQARPAPPIPALADLIPPAGG
jgi:hypothetical protein